ncbi:MAG: hypothetical protein J7K88_13115 [Candidatus Fermentibacteraceae bacterium]|nr:hypothetical protein [Candidatus Fermentibacteraceae bacterium]
MTIKVYDGKNCPCPADCVRHGNCKLCIEFHHSKSEVTYCEHLAGKLDDNPRHTQPERAIPSGKEIRLLDYAPCAG